MKRFLILIVVAILLGCGVAALRDNVTDSLDKVQRLTEPIANDLEAACKDAERQSKSMPDKTPQEIKDTVNKIRQECNNVIVLYMAWVALDNKVRKLIDANKFAEAASCVPDIADAAKTFRAAVLKLPF